MLKKEHLFLKVEEPTEKFPMLRFSASFPCPACKKKIDFQMISKKLVNNERGKLSWSVSNFQSHFKLHFKQEKSQPEETEKQKPLETFFKTENFENSTKTADSQFIYVQLAGTVGKNTTQPIEISDELFEDASEIAARKSNKRKFNVILDDDMEEKEFSGEAKSGVLAGQNTSDPLWKMMP